MPSLPRSALSPSRPANATRWARRQALACSVPLVLATIGVAPAQAARARTAAVTLTRVVVDASAITIAGRVQLPVNTASERRRTLVWLSLVSVTGTTAKSETFTAKLDAAERFSVTHITRFTGALGLGVLVKIAGRASGKKRVETINVAGSGQSGSPASTSGTSNPGSSKSGSSTSGSSPGSSKSGSSGGSPPGGPETPAEKTPSEKEKAPAQPSNLDGTFKLVPGTDVAGAIGGSWFEMLDADEAKREPLQNGNSPLANKDYTPLSPGTSGGLQTFARQAPPSPAFSEENDGREVGNALADEIMQPQSFFGFDFSVVDQASDPQTSEADPLPSVVDDAGQLSGQTTAWAVGWNGQWFNQGSPKPNGAFPGGTTAVSGTYNAATGAYVLEWKSLIVGGPFNGFLGSWHLEGTFVPAS
ncbi:MAG: hypothetical protein ABSG93_02925 [Solirubrobacteraceae bacterium]